MNLERQLVGSVHRLGDAENVGGCHGNEKVAGCTLQDREDPAGWESRHDIAETEVVATYPL